MNLLPHISVLTGKAAETPAVIGSPRLIWMRRNSVVTLLIFACLTMCFVAFEQNRTISSQQELIRSLFRDSLELNAMKMHGLRSDEQRSASHPSALPQQ